MADQEISDHMLPSGTPLSRRTGPTGPGFNGKNFFKSVSAVSGGLDDPFGDSSGSTPC